MFANTNLTHLFIHYGFESNLYSILFSILIIFTLLVVGKYSKNYLKNEVGEKRFWLLFVFFAVGMFISCFSKNLKTFYVGWEIVGLASFFLIGFYQTNIRSLENSLIALSNYKICDIFFVMAILFEESNFKTLAGFSLIIATLAKSAQLPFSSWLYRALEGPTPSSTLFYGGLSIHLGAFVLLRFSDLWDHSIYLQILIGLIGFSSALYGFLVGSTRSDLKTSFAFASISQVGLIYIELAFGLYELALWHIIGHNLLRTWNYLRGMSFFDEFFKIQYHDKTKISSFNNLLKKLPHSFYFHALNSFYLDQIFILTRKWGLIVFALFSFSILFISREVEFTSCALLASGVLLSISIYFKESLNPIYYTLCLVVSQVLILFSIHNFFEDELEHLYLIISGISLIFLLYSLAPAFKKWFSFTKEKYDSYKFLGLSSKYKLNHIVFLVAAILLTGAPGSFEFFIQEGILDEIWSKSHLFLLITMVGLTLNTIHTFKIGQSAFLGEKS